MLEPPWARSAMLLEELDPLRRASGNEAFACPVWRDRARRSQDHRIGSRELGPFFEILQPVVLPLAPRPVRLGFRPSCLSPKRGFPPGTLVSPTASTHGDLAGWGCWGLAPGQGCQRWRASLG